MKSSRREFLQGSVMTAGLALAGCRFSEISQFVDDLRVGTRFAVLAAPRVTGGPAADAFKKSLLHLRKWSAETIVIIGDLTLAGLPAQYELLAGIWRTVFPADASLFSSGPRLVLVPGPVDDVAVARPALGELESALSDGRALVIDDFRIDATAAKYPDRKLALPAGISLGFYAEGSLSLTGEDAFFPRDSRRICAGSLSGVKPWGESISPDSARKAVQGLLVSTYSGDFEIRRVNLLTGEDLAEAWSVPIDPQAEVPAFANEPPEFPAGSRIAVAEGLCPSTARTGSPKALEQAYVISWPSVTGLNGGTRAFGYGLRIFRDGQVIVWRSIHSKGFHLPPKRDFERPSYLLPLADLKGTAEGAELKFEVTPISATGRRGQPLIGQIQFKPF